MVHGAEPCCLRKYAIRPHGSSPIEKPNRRPHSKTLSTHLTRHAKLAAARSAVHQHILRNYHNRRLAPRSFIEGDLILRLNQEQPKKLESPWEGPYVATEVIPGGAYRLKNVESG